MSNSLNQQLIDFLNASPTPFHATASIASILKLNDFHELNEQDAWQLKPGRYFVTRNDSSIVAFVLGETSPIEAGFRMVGAHTDSPCLRVKPKAERRAHGYLNIGVETYGGVLLNPWFDRDLSLAGRVTLLMSDGSLQNRLIDFKRAIGTIPSLAIHLNREANKGQNINTQNHIPPLLMQGDTETDLKQLLLKQLQEQYPGLEVQDVLGHELSFYDTQSAAQIGLQGDFIASARLDNLLSCFVGAMSIIDADASVSSVLVCNDHEEVGSASAEGAEGPFLKSVLERILPNSEDLTRAISRSILISTDNAHGIHPNYGDRHDANHGPILNQGPVIKINANHRYATSGETAAYFRKLCDEQAVPHQSFVTRTDMACGSTIGPLTAKTIGVKTLDVGLATFGMHSIRELGGSEDAAHLQKALIAFYQDQGTLGATPL